MRQELWKVENAVIAAVRRAEEELRETGREVEVDGRRWREAVGVGVKLEVSTLPTVGEARELAVRIGKVELERAFETEAEDYMRHASALRDLLRTEEDRSRRVVSVLGPPKCPTSLQVLRRREWGRESLRIAGFMRSERLDPLLPLDLLNHLWAVREAVGEDLPARLAVLIGSLHVEVPAR